MLECLRGLLKQPVNARVLHRMLDAAYVSNADIMAPMVASFVLGKTVHFEINAGTYPHARIWTDKFEGYLLLLGNVSRIMLLPDSTLDVSWMRACSCKAGHLFLARLRLFAPFACECGSFLNAWQHSVSKTGTCPFHHVNQAEIPVSQIEYHATLVADARKIVEKAL